MLPLIAFIPLLLAIVLVLLPYAINRWRYRAIPGPFSLPFIGHLPQFIKYGTQNYVDMCRKKYGKVFKLYMGSNMMVMVADPDLARRLNYRYINRNLGVQLQTDKDAKDAVGLVGLVAAKGELWRSLRLAWQPAFQSGSLEGYASLMDSCAVKLRELLEPAAEAGTVVNIWRELGKMTMQVVGTTAYGVDFHTMASDGSKESQAGMQLVRASATVFSSSGVTRGSWYLPLAIMFPWAAPLWSLMARNFPDRRMTDVVEARKQITEVSQSLIDSWKAAHAAPSSKVQLTASATISSPPLEAPDSPDAVATFKTSDLTAVSDQDRPSTDSPIKRLAGAGVSPGSFLGLLLTARHRGTGEQLNDKVVIAQSNTFILAGYETTANTLAFSIYNIARYPEVQRKLLQEVDAFGRDRAVATADMEQFPYVEAVVKEALRLYPPATLLNRKVAGGGLEVLPGVVVPEGSTVFSTVYSYQRDEEYWPQPLEFKPERFLPEGEGTWAPKTPNAWTPFGVGPRMCIGWKFALQEAKIALVRLYQQHTFELAPGQVPLKVQQNLTMGPAEGVFVRVHKRN